MKALRGMLCALATLALVWAAGAPPALAAGPEWAQLDENAESSFYYDKAGVSRMEPGVYRVTTRVVYTEEGKGEALKALSAREDFADLYESRYVHDLNCGEKESHLLNAAHYGKDGKLLRSTDLSTVTEWEAIPPEVRLMSVLMEACPN